MNIQAISKALGGHTPVTTPFRPERSRAAVALILNEWQGETRLCFILRAERDGDPWSGHMAFPGGRADPGDESARAVAERETAEETGLELPGEALIAPLSEVPIRLWGRDVGMVLSPFVYRLEGEPAEFRFSHEVADAFWVPLDHLWDVANAAEKQVSRMGITVAFPAVAIGEHLLWGLTYRVLTQFSDLLDRPLPQLVTLPEGLI